MCQVHYGSGEGGAGKGGDRRGGVKEGAVKGVGGGLSTLILTSVYTVVL